MDIHTPELYTSISDGQLDNLLQFCYGQLSSFYLAIATVHNMPLQTPGSEEVSTFMTIIIKCDNYYRLIVIH